MRVLMRSLAAAALALVAGCGSSGPSPVESCNDAVVAICHQVYTCFTPDEIAAANLPAQESACVSMSETAAGCSAKTTANFCDNNQKFHADQVDGCVSEVKNLTCAQVKTAGINNLESLAPTCQKVCTVSTGNEPGVSEADDPAE